MQFGRISGISSDRSRIEVKIGKNADLDTFLEFRLTGLGCRSQNRAKMQIWTHFV